MRCSLAFLAAAAAATVSAQWHGHGGGNGGGSSTGEIPFKHHGWGGWHLPGASEPASGVQNSTFEQLIDHNNPSLGTFSQFYFWDTQYWKGPGSPVILFTPGEVNVTHYASYLGTNRTTGVLAEKIGAATIVLEHRYWGVSSPFDDLTTENLQYLTLENAIKDLTHFAKTAQLPFATHFSSNADAVPWVLMGGSYSGALSAWTATVAPGTFWAYQASSAPVEAISDYWAYFLPVQQGMPKNCSADVTRVIDYMDNILLHGTADEVLALKSQFGLQDVEHNDDFMAALAAGPWQWQRNQFFTTGGFFQWCDYIENAENATAGSSPLPGPEGVGLEKALAGYARWWRDLVFPGYCAGMGYFKGTYNIGCLNTYNASSPLFTDTSLSNKGDRQWVWMTCNQPFSYWQVGAPTDRPTLVSRLVTPDYWIRQCGLYFPAGPQGQTYGLAAGRTEAEVNAYTGGWAATKPTERLIFVNGGYDPWRESGVSAETRPGGPLESSAALPVLVVPGGFHTSDLLTENGRDNPGCQAVIDAEVNQLAEWVGEWYTQRPSPPGDGWHGWTA